MRRAFAGRRRLLRGKENFHITGIPKSLESNFVKALGHVKKAAALANRDLGVLDRKVADAIANLALEILGHKKGEYQFVSPDVLTRASARVARVARVGRRQPAWPSRASSAASKTRKSSGLVQ